MAENWIFAYGSLMWRPGFAYEASAEAVMCGAHRSLCVYSIVHRGTRRRPGLVLGLDAGGSCRGVAYRVGDDAFRRILGYLRAREQVTRVYREVMRPVQLTGVEPRPVRALCYVADRLHPQYAGVLPLAAQARMVRRGHGRSGANTDYVVNTVRHLEEMGIDERPLARLMTALGHGPGRAR